MLAYQCDEGRVGEQRPPRLDGSGYRLEAAPEPLTWSLWSYTGCRPGRVSTGLVVHTVAGGGAQQVNGDRTSGREGASGLHRVVATVR